MEEKTDKQTNIEENAEKVLDIMLNRYNIYYTRIQNIDNKNGFFIAFHAAALFFTINIEKIKKILGLNFENIGQALKYESYILLEISMMVITIIAIVLFILSLKSRDYKYIPEKICDEEFLKAEKHDLNQRLLEAYKELFKYNEGIMEKKHTLFNLGLTLTLVDMVLRGIIILYEISL